MTTTKHTEPKEAAQQKLTQFDESLDQHFEQIEEDIFNRKERLQQLEEGIIPETNTILSAVFQEIKKKSDETRKKSTKKSKIHFFKAKPKMLVFVRRTLQAGKAKISKGRIRIVQLCNSRSLRNSATAQTLARVCPKDSITYLHASSTRLPVA